MKTFVLFICAMLLPGPIQAAAFSLERGEKPIVVSGRPNCPLVPSIGGTLYLQISITTPVVELPRRKPMNLSIVLDRSGSMADERKIQYAKSALYSLVEQLSPEDLLSVVIYDDVVEVLRQTGRVRDRKEIFRLVEQIAPRGSTNLGGGLVEGLKQAAKYASREYVNRVLLLSDGLANQGITDPRQLNKIARSYRGRAISVTTMGVGLDYNENLMVGLAEHGGGNYYFIESPHSLAHILRREFDAMTTILAQNAVLEINLGRDVQVLDVIGYQWTQQGNRCSVSLGDLYSDRSQEITLELRIPEGYGSLDLAHGSLRYETDKPWLKEGPEFRSTVTYSSDPEAVEQHRDMDVQARADIAVSTRKVDQAMEALDAGDAEHALRELESAKTYLQSSPAAEAAGAGALLREQSGRLESFERMLKDSSDSRKAKKSIQYDNYRIQKNNQ